MQESTVSIRSATPADIDAVMKIENESFVPGTREERGVYLKRMRAFPDGFLVAQNTETGEIGGFNGF